MRDQSLDALIKELTYLKKEVRELRAIFQDLNDLLEEEDNELITPYESIVLT